jgi:hypothetical protein
VRIELSEVVSGCSASTPAAGLHSIRRTTECRKAPPPRVTTLQFRAREPRRNAGQEARDLLAGVAGRKRSRRNAVRANKREKHRRRRKILERGQARTMFTVLIHPSTLKRRQTQDAAITRAKSESVRWLDDSPDMGDICGYRMDRSHVVTDVPS